MSARERQYGHCGFWLAVAIATARWAFAEGWSWLWEPMAGTQAAPEQIDWGHYDDFGI